MAGRNASRRHGGTAGRATTCRRWTAALLVLATWVAVGTPAAAQDDGDDDPGPLVIVATKPLDPFVMLADEVDVSAGTQTVDDEQLSGYSIDVWNEVADRLGLETEWVVEPTVNDILDAARRERADVAIAGISMTAERETFVDFSHPYYDSGLRIVARPSAGRGTLGTIVDVVSNRRILTLAGGLIALAAVVAHLVWWTERSHNDEFPRSYREGIVEALWWSTVSVVTGGEAVKNIRGPMSRLLALGWMVIGLFLIAFVTAQAAASLTVNELQSDIGGLDDLASRKVVTVEGTVAETFLTNINLAPDTVADIDTALQAVADGRYDAVVYDAPVLAYRVDTDFAGTLELVGDTFAPDPYGIALTTGSALREPINAELLSMSRDGTLDTLNQKWLGVDR